jgi:antitoxin ParD1/3/4
LSLFPEPHFRYFSKFSPEKTTHGVFLPDFYPETLFPIIFTSVISLGDFRYFESVSLLNSPAITKIVILCYQIGTIIRQILGDNPMNVSLTPELEKFVANKVTSGLYNSASEVIRESLRLLKNHDTLREMRLNELRSQIQTGIDSGEPQPLDIEDVIKRGKKRYAQRQKIV